MLLRFFSNVMTKALSLLLQCLVNEMRSQTTARKGQAIIYQMKKTPILEHATADFQIYSVVIVSVAYQFTLH